MPGGNKIIRQKKVRGCRVVYLSSRIDKHPPDHTDWMNVFWGRLSFIVKARPDVFKNVMRTGDAAAATILARRLEDGGITDVVAVLTDGYLSANLKAAKPVGELVHFFGELLKRRVRGKATDTDSETPVRFFLAPLDPPVWDISIGEVPLNDARLKRLKESRFTWLRESSYTPNEIADAVDVIVKG